MVLFLKRLPIATCSTVGNTPSWEPKRMPETDFRKGIKGILNLRLSREIREKQH